jgi:hypothetical protein
MLYTWHKLGSKYSNAKLIQDSTEKKKTYDVFISYANEDHLWVTEELVPKLEKEHQFKCCFHERDFQIGVTVMQNIVNCVDKSQVFVVVLTPSYVNSTWCMFELFLAQSRLNQTMSTSLQLNSQNLIIVVKQSIDKMAISRIDKRMQMTLKLWTYLEWPKAHNKLNTECKNSFWQKLATCVHNSLNNHYQSIA